MFGSVIALLGLLSIIVGAVATLVADTVSSLNPAAEATAPGSVTFAADDTNYVVFIDGSRYTASSSVASLTTCDIELANEQDVHIDGSRQGVSSESANYASVGNFDAVAGRTTVTCEIDGERGVRFFIDSQGSIRDVALWLLILGFVVVSIGAALVLGGIFWKKPARTYAR